MVAACVMTCEARENGAKVVPSRYRMGEGGNSQKLTKVQRSRESASSGGGGREPGGKWDGSQPGGPGAELLLIKGCCPVVAAGPGGAPGTRKGSRRKAAAAEAAGQRNLHHHHHHGLHQDREFGKGLKKSPSAPVLTDKKFSRKRPTKHTGQTGKIETHLLKRQALSVDNPIYGPQQRVSR